MKYYTIDHRTDRQVGNVFPQVDFDSVHEVEKFNFHEFPSEEPILSCKLEKGAKLTDVLSQAEIRGKGFLMNKKVKVIFDEFSLMNHKYYPCTVKDHWGKTHQYYWLNMVQPDLINYIDFPNSEFFTTEGGFKEDPISVESLPDYHKKKELLPDITWGIEAYSVKLTEVTNYDFYSFPFIYYNKLVTENLKNRLEKEKIKGLQFTEAPVYL